MTESIKDDLNDYVDACIRTVTINRRTVSFWLEDGRVIMADAEALRDKAGNRFDYSNLEQCG